MPVIYRPGWTWPSDAGRLADEVVADADDVVTEATGDGRAWLTLLLGSPPFDQLLQSHEGVVSVRRVVSA